MYTRLSRANNNVNLYMACRLCYNTLKISQERNMSNQSAASKKSLAGCCSGTVAKYLYVLFNICRDVFLSKGIIGEH